MYGSSRGSNRSKRGKNYRDVAAALSQQSTPIFDNDMYLGRGLYVDASDSNQLNYPINDRDADSDILHKNYFDISQNSRNAALHSTEVMPDAPMVTLVQFMEDSTSESLIFTVESALNQSPVDEKSLHDAVCLLSPEHPDEFVYIARQLLLCSCPAVVLQVLFQINTHADNKPLYERLISLKTHLFLIQLFELSTSSRVVREAISNIFSVWVDTFPKSIPYSLAASLVAVASEASDPMRPTCLHLLLKLLINNTSLLIACDGFSALLRGCVEIQDDSLLQSSLLASLHLLNTPTYRRPMILMDLQYVMEPLLTETSTSDTSLYYIANLAILTIMRSWNGLLIFGSDLDGFPNYVSVLAARGEENTILAKEMLSSLFVLLGIPAPSLLLEDEVQRHTIYWTDCSLYLDYLSFSCSKRKQTNLLTTYLSLVVAMCLYAKLPETLITIAHHEDKDVSYLANQLLNVITLLADIFFPSSNSCRTALSSSYVNALHSSQFLSLQCYTVESSYMYPVIQHTAYSTSDLIDYFSWFIVFENILDYYCDNSHANESIRISDFICTDQIVGSKVISHSLTGLYREKEQFIDLLRQTNKKCMMYQDQSQWDWQLLFSLLLITSSSNQFVNEFVKSRIMAALEESFAPGDGSPPFSTLPITSKSIIQVCCMSLWMVILLDADSQLVGQSRKLSFLQYLIDSVVKVTHHESGSFSSLSLRNTNAYFYAIIAVHVLFSARIRCIMDIASMQNAFLSFSYDVNLFMDNPDFLRIMINELHITDESAQEERNYFSSLIHRGNVDVQHLCLTRIQSALCEQVENEEFIMWCLPLVVFCVGLSPSLTVLSGSILESIVAIGPYTDLIVSVLSIAKDKIHYLVDSLDCLDLAFHLIETEAGFELFNENDDLASVLFDTFMNAGIYDYVINMENVTTASLLQNPSTTSVASFFLDGDQSLPVQPLHIRPPRNIQLQMMRDDLFHVWWMPCIPWKIVANKGDINFNVDVSVGIVAPHLRAQGEDLSRSTIRLHGTFKGHQDHLIHPLNISRGDVVHVSLCVGNDVISHNKIKCEFKLSGLVNPDSLSWSLLTTKNENWDDSVIHRVSSGCCVWDVAYESSTDSYNLFAVEFVCKIVPHKPLPVIVHPHLIASLVSSECGRRFLHNRLDMAELCRILTDQQETVINRKAVIWTVAHIATKEKGVDYLQDHCHIDAVDLLLSIASSDPILSLRGTALMACSYLASNPSLHSAIEEHQWFCESHCGNSVCIPLKPFTNIVSENSVLTCCSHFRIQTTSDLQESQFSSLSYPSFSSLHQSKYPISSIGAKQSRCPSDIIIKEPETTEDEAIVVELIISLNSVIFCQEARKRLQELKKIHPEFFRQPRLFVYMHHLISALSLPCRWRKFVFELFSSMNWTKNEWDIFDSFPCVSKLTYHEEKSVS